MVAAVAASSVQRDLVSPRGIRSSRPPPAVLRRSSSLRFEPWSSSRDGMFQGGRLVAGSPRGMPSKGHLGTSGSTKMTLSFKKAVNWWEKGLQPNMKEIESAEDLAYSLLNAGDQLVVVDFFSPGCGGCRALHPKICQIAELNPDVLFLQINYEQHKSMCYSLHVHVLPFFRFYRGAQGRLCSFSCTNATIKKFKDALSKHITDRCSLGPARGLEEEELLALAANKDLTFDYPKKPVLFPKEIAEIAPTTLPVPLLTRETENKTLAMAAR
ncbi:thioredoxin-like 1-2, chloroplastic [Curcuma longa]|uniref:thioredoxin-like 1-2, chloroplastic n=1 Tax=Curcuma longa TaxID=136217 RepID=UPI003D9EC081